MNFSERLDEVHRQIQFSHRDLPREVRNYLVAKTICADIVVTTKPSSDIEDQNFCRYADLDEKRERLEKLFGKSEYTAYYSQLN